MTVVERVRRKEGKEECEGELEKHFEHDIYNGVKGIHATFLVRRCSMLVYQQASIYILQHSKLQMIRASL